MRAQGRAGAASPLRVGALIGLVVVVAVAIFGLGVMVGERVAESVTPVAAPPPALPTEGLVPVPPPSGTDAPGTPVPIPPEKLTFYDRLSRKTTGGPLEIPVGQAPPSAAVALRPDPATAIAPHPAETAAVVSQAPKIVPPGALRPATSGKTPSSAPPAPVKTVAPTSAPPPKTASPADAAVAKIRKLLGKGRYQVQVAASQQRDAADDVAARFKKQGFDVVTTMAVVQGRTWYRVRVGNFPSRQAAVRAAGIFKSALDMGGVVVHE